MTEEKVSLDWFFRIGLVVAIAASIFALMHALYSDAHSRGLPEPFQYLFYAAGFAILMLVLPRLVRKE